MLYQWKERALALDNYLGYSNWKRSPPNAYYDAPLIRRVVRSLREMRTNGDVEGVRAVLEVALRSNFAGVESSHLYSETFYGTKDLVQGTSIALWSLSALTHIMILRLY